jgi:hypothetical protein
MQLLQGGVCGADLTVRQTRIVKPERRSGAERDSKALSSYFIRHVFTASAR